MQRGGKLMLKKTLITSTLILAGFGVHAQQLDVSDPNQALLASNKIFCANEQGEISLYWWQGKSTAAFLAKKTLLSLMFRV